MATRIFSRVTARLLGLIGFFVANVAWGGAIESTSSAPSAVVQNGIVYEKGELSLKGVKSLLLPAGTDVRPGAEGKLLFYLAKRLNFSGIPPLPMRIQNVRSFMGLASRRQRGELSVGTFGEFSTKEGGADIALLAFVPRSVQWLTREDLCGSESKAQGAESPKKPNEDYWYGPRAAAKGWTLVVTSLDTDRRFKRLQPGPSVAQ